MDYLEKVGWLGPDAWLAHGIHFSAEEIARLGRAKVGICHCPSSNMLLGSGICAALDLEGGRSPGGAGRGRLGLQRLFQSDPGGQAGPTAPAPQVRLGKSFPRGRPALGHRRLRPRCLGREDIGVVAPGKQADLALFKLDEPRFSGAGDPLAALVLCGAHRADRVMVGGGWVVQEGRIPGLDLERLMEAAPRNWPRNSGRIGPGLLPLFGEKVTPGQQSPFSSPMGLSAVADIDAARN